MIATLALSFLLGPSQYGLVEGRAPVYQVTYTGDSAKTFTATIRHLTTAQGCELFALDQPGGRKRFLGASPEGLFEFYAADMPGTKPDTDSPPILLLKANTKAGDSWTWVEPFRGQIAIGPDGVAPDMGRLASSCTARVVALQEPLTTPAGQFKTVHVEILRTSEAYGQTTTQLWLAPSLGIVKETYGNESWKSELVLIKV